VTGSQKGEGGGEKGKGKWEEWKGKGREVGRKGSHNSIQAGAHKKTQSSTDQYDSLSLLQQRQHTTTALSGSTKIMQTSCTNNTVLQVCKN